MADRRAMPAAFTDEEMADWLGDQASCQVEINRDTKRADDDFGDNMVYVVSRAATHYARRAQLEESEPRVLQILHNQNGGRTI